MGGHPRGYKRSWRNLILDKRYQLRFTLFMVGLAALLMLGLGWWVLRVADISTTVTINNLNGAMDVECKEPRSVVRASPPAEPPSAGPPRAVVTIDESMMPAAARRDVVDAPTLAAYEACKAKYARSIAALAEHEHRIIYALVAIGVVVVVGLTAYGIKMTHRVAGPLHKVAQYLDSLRAGTYQPLFNLRKGDQLAEFYDHFRQAYAGVKRLDEDDVVRLRAALAAADQAGLAARSPELAAAMTELRAILAAKEASLASI